MTDQEIEAVARAIHEALDGNEVARIAIQTLDQVRGEKSEQ